ncbi:MAG: PD40 domain-containing protein [Bauldia sp.]|nr:PD40 domain-containing protein [Bauldia sp.]
MHRFLRRAAPSLTIGAALALAGCGSDPEELAFSVTGSATDVFVSYRVGTNGEAIEARVSLPFTVSVPPGEGGSFALYAVDLAGPGSVECRVTQGDNVLAEADGGILAGCTGTLREAGGASVRLFEDTWPDRFVVPASATALAGAGPLLFTAISGGNRDPYIVDPASGEAPVRYVAGNLGTCLRWSPDGTRVAFLRSGEGAGLYAMNADATGLVLLDASIAAEGCPAWAPGGAELAFAGRAAAAGGGAAAGQIFVAAADGGGVRQITQNLDPSTRLGHPTWSPDGLRVAYVTTAPDTAPDAGLRPYDDRIFAVNADGTEALLLSDPERLVQDLAWAPDGDRLLYVCHDGIGNFGTGLCVVGIDGSGTERLTDSRFADIRSAAFAADGTTTIFLAERDGIRGIFGFGTAGVPILLVPLAGTGLTVDHGIAPYPAGAPAFAVHAAPLALPF